MADGDVRKTQNHVINKDLNVLIYFIKREVIYIKIQIFERLSPSCGLPHARFQKYRKRVFVCVEFFIKLLRICVKGFPVHLQCQRTLL